MKYFGVFALVFAMICAGAWFSISAMPPEPVKEEKESPTYCPKTLISDNSMCMECHTAPSFKLKQASPAEGLKLPWGVEYVEGGKLRYMVNSISSGSVQQLFDYVYWHPEFQHVVLEIHSGGGSLMDAWKIVGIIREAQAKGILVETRCYGLAASAGFVVFVAGDIGHRYVNKHAELMTHELWTFKFIDIATPSTKEQEADILRHFQDNVHDFLVDRCTGAVTKEELDEKVKYTDWWLTGEEMVGAGFAEHFVGGSGV